jgi:nucleoside 2-deoxyribosyltransferase
MNYSKRTKVYIASPYNKGNKINNVKMQMIMGDVLIKFGFLPFVPLLFHFQHYHHPLSYEEWMAIDLAWLETCDCVFRLNGESPGADREVSRAKELGIPVFYSIEQLIRSYNEN